MPRSRSSTGRSQGKPLGDESFESVRQANIMVGRVLILMLLCQARQIWWVVEQPVNSLLEHHPLFQQMLHMRSFAVTRFTTHMLYFGGRTLKPTWIYSSASMHVR